MNEYLMPANDLSNEIIIERSRFICHVFRVYTLDEANHHISQVKSEHSKANHNCVAYLIGDTHDFGRAYDDGEPSGTAGAPMLEVLQRQNLRNCLVIVTRYFGGIKLGAGGLIRAYGTAVSEGLSHAGIIKRVTMKSIFITCEYSQFESLQSKIKAKNLVINNVSYTDKIKLEIFVELTDVPEFNTWIVEVTNNSVIIDAGEISYKEIPVK
jgi:uncharacterized YigZ family protein